jgi:excisionase family DNA binding protein
VTSFAILVDIGCHYQLELLVMPATANYMSRDDTPRDSLTKVEAAEFLGCASRTLLRWIASGKLASHTVRGPSGQNETRIDKASAEALKREFDTPALRGVPSPGTEMSLAVQEVAPIAREFSASLGAALKEIAGAMREGPKPWLTIDEAVEFSGLSRAWLMRQVSAETKDIAIRDMGKNARGGRWRFSKDSLAAWYV